MAIGMEDTILTKEIIDKYVSEGSWTGETLVDYLDRAVKLNPDKIAVVDKKERVTYGQLDLITTRIACGFLEFGIKKGDVVAVQLPNWIEFVYTHLALNKIGAITSPVIPYYRQNELIYELGLTDAIALVIPSEFRGFDYTSMIPDLREAVSSLKHCFVVGDRVPEGATPFNELREKRWEDSYSEEDIKRFRPKGTDVDVLLFSSGTTAEPKGILHTHDDMICVNRTLNRVLGLSSVDVVLVPSPVSHGTGLQWGVRQSIMLGAKMVLQEIWTAEEGCRLIEEEGCTYIFAATPFIRDLVEFEDRSKYDIRSLRIFASAGAPIPRELGIQAEKVGFKLVSSYGASEHFVSISCYPSDPPEKIYETDGIAIPGVEAGIFDESRKQLPPGETGELAVRGPIIACGYYKRPEWSEATFTKEGWQFTGDLAVKRSDGYIRIVGRKKDIIIRGGFNISPREIENILLAHPKIQDVSIVGMPDKRLGERSCAYVIPKQGVPTITLEEVVSFLKDKKLAMQKLPERLEIVSEFPMTAAGKVQKYLLREAIANKLKKEKTSN